MITDAASPASLAVIAAIPPAEPQIRAPLSNYENHPWVNAGMARVATLFTGPESGFPGVPAALEIARQVSISGM